MDRSRLALPVLAAVAVSFAMPCAAVAAKPPNPCLNLQLRATLRCPDLVMKKPFGLYLDRITRPGRVLLRAGNSIDNIGTGPAELHGRRIGRFLMRGRQRIYRVGGGRIGIDTGARLFFKFAHANHRYWKFRNAARFALWRLNAAGVAVRRVRTGPKVSYCLRDLVHSRPHRARSPRRRVYPACSISFGKQRVTLGTSVGWSDVYPPTYPEQWIDVTGLRGCFSYRHTADPLDRIYESDETNNTSSVTVRLPFRPGRQRCVTADPGAAPLLTEVVGAHPAEPGASAFIAKPSWRAYS